MVPENILTHRTENLFNFQGGWGGEGGRLNDNIILKGKMKLERKLEFSKGWKGESPPPKNTFLSSAVNFTSYLNLLLYICYAPISGILLFCFLEEHAAVKRKG